MKGEGHPTRIHPANNRPWGSTYPMDSCSFEAAKDRFPLLWQESKTFQTAKGLAAKRSLQVSRALPSIQSYLILLLFSLKLHKEPEPIHSSIPASFPLLLLLPSLSHLLRPPTSIAVITACQTSPTKAINGAVIGQKPLSVTPKKASTSRSLLRCG